MTFFGLSIAVIYITSALNLLYTVFLVNALLGAADELMSDILSSYYWITLFITAGISFIYNKFLKEQVKKSELSESKQNVISSFMSGLFMATAASSVRAVLPFGLDILSPGNLILFIFSFGLPGGVAGVIINKLTGDRLLRAGGNLGLISGVIYTLMLSQRWSSGLEGDILALSEFLAPVIGAIIGVKLFSFFKDLFKIEKIKDFDNREFVSSFKKDGGILIEKIIAHRIETEGQLRQAIEEGFSMVEFDVQLTRDNKLVAFWCELGENEVVYDYTLAELEEKLGKRLLNIDNAFAISEKLVIIFDVKDWASLKYSGYEENVLNKIEELIEKYNLQERAIFASFNP